MLLDKRFSVAVPVSDELLELWKADDCGFTEYFRNKLLKGLQESFDLEQEKIIDEAMNGTGDDKPIGFIHA